MRNIEPLEGVEARLDDLVLMPGLPTPPDKPHPFVYFITITNSSPEPVQIIARKWVVEESENVEVFEGEGVVGRQPVLRPGESFSYNSYHVISAKARATGAFYARRENGAIGRIDLASFLMNVETLK